MAPKIKHKRSALVNNPPTAAQIEAGEIAINTNSASANLHFEDDGATVRSVGADPSAAGTYERNVATPNGVGTWVIAGSQPPGSDSPYGHWDRDSASATLSTRIAGDNIVTTGRVGIGTTDTASLLNLSGNNSGTGSDWSKAKNLIRIEDLDTTQASGQTVGGVVFEGNDSDTGAKGVQAAITANTNSATGGGQLRFYTAATSSTLTGTEDPRLIIDGSGNVGIRTPTPSVRLEVARSGQAWTGAAPVTGTTAFFHNGSNTDSAPSYLLLSGGRSSASGVYFGDSDAADIGSLRYLHSDDSLRIDVNSSERMRITSAGNVGIGTSNPGEKLSIEDSTGAIINLESGVNVANLVQGINFYGRFVDGVTPPLPGQLTSYIHEERQGTGAFAQTFGLSDGTSDATERMRITSTGDVGIGTTAPNYRLQVSESNNASVSIEVTGDNTASRAGRLVYSFSDGDGAAINANRSTGETAGDVFLSFRTGGITTAQERMRILANGNVGIGTTAPSTQLEVVSTSPEIKARSTANASSSLGLDNVRGAGLVGGQVYGQWGGNNVSAIRFINGADNVNKDDGLITFNTKSGPGSLVERLRIDADGNVGIGTTNPGEKLDVVGNVKAASFVIDQATADVTLAAANPAAARTYTFPDVGGDRNVVLDPATPATTTQYAREINAAGVATWEEIDVPPGTHVGETPPTAPEQGSMWWNSGDGRLYVYYEDADSSQWVAATPEQQVEEFWQRASGELSPVIAGDDVKVGDFTTGGTSNGSMLFADGVVAASRSGGTDDDAMWSGYYNSLRTSRINADGGAVFSGVTRIGDPDNAVPNSPDAQGVRISNSGLVRVKKSTAGPAIAVVNASDTTNVLIDAAGNAEFAGTVTATVVPPSDAKFKQNITPANPQLADVVALGNQLKNFDWNEDAPVNDEIRAQRQLGLIAQEAELICPSLVKTIKRTKQGAELLPETTDADGNVTPATYEELDDSYKGISHDALIMKLLGAVAELQAEVQALKGGN